MEEEALLTSSSTKPSVDTSAAFPSSPSSSALDPKTPEKDIDGDNEESYVHRPNVNFLSLMNEQFPEEASFIPSSGCVIEDPKEHVFSEDIQQKLGTLQQITRERKKSVADTPEISDDFLQMERGGGEEASVSAAWKKQACVWKDHRYDKRHLAIALHEEILDFERYVSLTQEEMDTRMELVERFEEHARSLWPQCDVYIFGSLKTGLCLPSSDVDLSIINVQEQKLDRLFRLAEMLEERGVVSSMEVISSARIPIINCIDAMTGIRVDISFDTPNGIENSNLIQSYIREFPPLRHLVLILKMFLRERDLHDTYTGGIGSYLLVMMVVSHLQMYPFNFGNGSPSVVDLGTLLKDFFLLYGKLLDMHSVGIRIENGGSYFPKGMIDRPSYSSRPGILCILDPHDATNDIGKNSYQMSRARSAFEYAYHALTSISLNEKIDQNLRSRKEHSRDERAFSLLHAPTLLSRIITSGRLLHQHRMYVLKQSRDAHSDPQKTILPFRSPHVLVDGRRHSDRKKKRKLEKERRRSVRVSDDGTVPVTFDGRNEDGEDFCFVEISSDDDEMDDDHKKKTPIRPPKPPKHSQGIGKKRDRTPEKATGRDTPLAVVLRGDKADEKDVKPTEESAQEIARTLPEERQKSWNMEDIVDISDSDEHDDGNDKGLDGDDDDDDDGERELSKLESLSKRRKKTDTDDGELSDEEEDEMSSHEEDDNKKIP